MKRDFKGVWIPAEIWLDDGLTWREKLFLTEIDSLDNERGCFASNNYFSKFFKLTPQRCSQVINDLINKRYISSEIERDGERIVKRTLRVVNKFDRGYQENLQGYQEKFKDNNTINNTLSFEEKAAEEAAKEKRKKMKTLFFELYAAKAKEVTGTDLTADGNKIAPTWGAKENTLLKDDVETNGPVSMDRYIKLFFSDKVSEVKDFCRGKNKAGYSYSVFHGMIEKLKLSKIPLPRTCEHCGQIEGHSETCPITIEKRRKEEEERKIILEEKEKAGDLNLLKQVKQNVKQRVS